MIFDKKILKIKKYLVGADLCVCPRRLK